MKKFLKLVLLPILVLLLASHYVRGESTTEELPITEGEIGTQEPIDETTLEPSTERTTPTTNRTTTTSTARTTTNGGTGSPDPCHDNEGLVCFLPYLFTK